MLQRIYNGNLCFYVAELLGLLKWRDEPEKIEEHLRNLVTLDGEEVVKVILIVYDLAKY